MRKVEAAEAEAAKAAKGRQAAAAAAEEVAAMEKERSAPSAWSASTIPGSACTEARLHAPLPQGVRG